MLELRNQMKRPRKFQRKTWRKDMLQNTPPANQDKETTANEAEETTARIKLPSEAALLRLRRMLGGTPATIIPHQRTHKQPKFFTPSEYDQSKSKYW
ncbi:hypothetical protein M5689_006834 [Euphorbia peplus]|nr:hypothetical protein M5689_006834 [Euphorbia peplus]